MALIKKEFICSAEEYESNEGKKTSWKRIGEILTFETQHGGHFRKLKLYAMPNISYSVFEDKKKEDQTQQSYESDPNTPF